MNIEEIKFIVDNRQNVDIKKNIKFGEFYLTDFSKQILTYFSEKDTIIDMLSSK